MELRCDCGHVARGDEESDLIDNVRAHASGVHHVELSRDLIHELTVRAAADQEGATRRAGA
ncbi:MAG TPA: DUF1059 domain-containing protein [Acidimicrobiia bacterium]|nr:DUF1059 domain-containing protein [Acidimicrobiia bacterium]